MKNGEYFISANDLEKMIMLLIDNKISLKNLSIQRKNLNDVFLKLTMDDDLG